MHDPCRSQTYIKRLNKKGRMYVTNFEKLKGQFLVEQRPTNQKLNKDKRNTSHNVSIE